MKPLDVDWLSGGEAWPPGGQSGKQPPNACLKEDSGTPQSLEPIGSKQAQRKL